MAAGMRLMDARSADAPRRTISSMNEIDPRDNPTADLDRQSAASRPVLQRFPRELSLVEFPADEPERARRFWSGLLGIQLDARDTDEGAGWQSHGVGPSIGVHARGRGLGDTFSLPYFSVGDLELALEHVVALGGTVVHPGSRWAICKDCEGSPFGLALDPAVS